jgi:hypothetical protein
LGEWLFAGVCRRSRWPVTLPLREGEFLSPAAVHENRYLQGGAVPSEQTAVVPGGTTIVVLCAGGGGSLLLKLTHPPNRKGITRDNGSKQRRMDNGFLASVTGTNN